MSDPIMPTRSAAPGETAFVSGLGELAACYDLVLCDVWGVLHDGIVGFALARDALARYRQGGGTVLLLSNAPRPGSVIGAQLERFGVGAACYDAIVTSGDLTRTIVIERQGETLFHLGPDRDLPIYDGVNVAFGSLDEADYVVCTGLVEDETETVEDYAPLLRRMRQRDLWMLCANPDIVVERGSRLVYCAGALAAAYETLGGRTFYPGKPHRPIYEQALATASLIRRGPTIEVGRVLAIGDSLRTDIAGAQAFGADSLMIGRGIHASELGLDGERLDAEQARAWLDRQDVRPTAMTAELSWD